MSSFQYITTAKKEAQQIPVENILGHAFQKGLPIALWRLPHQQKFKLVIGMETKTVSLDELETHKGFLVSPFVQKEDKVFFIPANLYAEIETKENKASINSENIQSTSLEALEVQDFLKEVSQHPKEKLHYHTTANEKHIPRKEQFITAVNHAIAEMEVDNFQKVVLSRNKKEPLPPSFNIIDSFLKLSEAYPNAFISLISTPETGTWMGASPEILVEVTPENQFKTVALAGTQKRSLFPSLKEVTWRQKEIEEQAMVSRYIINCFKQIRLREFEEIGPRTVAAGGMVHLRTDFLVDLKETNFLELGSIMLKLLHPTSAVCGMPKQKAMNFLNEHEHYDRKLFSGFLGPLNFEESTNLFVNLRCVQLTQTHVIYYAGAGVTADSIAEKEWEETALKMETVAACI